jgi:microcystin-dependent protein
MVYDGHSRHTPELSGVKVIRALSIDSALLPHVSDAVATLTEVYGWFEVGDSVTAIVSECVEALDSWYTPMIIGQISQFLGSLPSGWLALDGSTYDEDDYPELWELLDAQFKNESASTFTLPDFGGLVLVATGNGFLVGDDGGLADVTLSIAEIPAHTHTYIQPIANVDLEAPGVPDILAAGVGPGTNTGSTGSGDSHENMQPYFTVVMGIFSGRA